jgi:hypothetical protein
VSRAVSALASHDTPSLVISAICVRDSGRLVLCAQAACGFCGRSMQPPSRSEYAICGRCGTPRKSTVLQFRAAVDPPREPPNTACGRPRTRASTRAGAPPGALNPPPGDAKISQKPAVGYISYIDWKPATELVCPSRSDLGIRRHTLATIESA